MILNKPYNESYKQRQFQIAYNLNFIKKAIIMKFPKLDLRKKLNTVTDSEGNIFTVEKVVNGYIVNCKGYENRFCFADDTKIIFEGFMSKDYRKEIDRILNKWTTEKAELKKGIKMLTIKDILAVKPQFILAVDYNAGSIGEIVGENRDLNKYLAEMTIQYYSPVNNTCLAFDVECLVSVNDNKVTIEDMNTSNDYQTVYARNIAELTSINGNTINIHQDDLSDVMRDFLIDLIENQPIYDAPENFIIEAY